MVKPLYTRSVRSGPPTPSEESGGEVGAVMGEVGMVACLSCC